MQFNIFQHFQAISTYILGYSSSVSMSGQGYTPRGKGTLGSQGSKKSGGGNPQNPSNANVTAGHTNKSQDSGTPGGGNPQNPSNANVTGGHTNNSQASTSTSGHR
ncbi:hypothetical protein IW261DRAFT_1424594 [Armillaria novae-zelandiae]|uniref:Uncharacterized protein n=1 Tax=Armillaria novae-zelandiae TaxID=153914 RepID=A0AA39NUW7_9AGAR|nr:hypothetical protein IW261DRAFT_1424594 [Armillaria novae-zelandiae]